MSKEDIQNLKEIFDKNPPKNLHDTLVNLLVWRGCPRDIAENGTLEEKRKALGIDTNHLYIPSNYRGKPILTEKDSKEYEEIKRQFYSRFPN